MVFRDEIAVLGSGAQGIQEVRGVSRCQVDEKLIAGSDLVALQKRLIVHGIKGRSCRLRASSLQPDLGHPDNPPVNEVDRDRLEAILPNVEVRGLSHEGGPSLWP